MKRTKQAFYKDHDDVPKFVSGCRQFDGEDTCKHHLTFSFTPFIIFDSLSSLAYAERMKQNADL